MSGTRGFLSESEEGDGEGDDHGTQEHADCPEGREPAYEPDEDGEDRGDQHGPRRRAA